MMHTARRGSYHAVLALAAVACLGGEARALDVVRLRNGRSLEGEVKEETSKYVMLEYEGGLVRIKRADISAIDKDRPVADWEVEMRIRARREAAAVAKAALEEFEASLQQGTEPGAEVDEQLESEEAERLKKLIEDMASADADARRLARELVEREGGKAVPALTEALFHSSSFVRTAAADILGDVRARQSVRDMIVALRSAVPEKVKVRPWQRQFVKEVRDGLRGITGQSFGLRARGADQGKAAAAWVEWWDGKPSADKPGAVPKGAYADWDTPQVGEPKLDEKDKEYARKLFEARRVGNTRHSYTAPAGFGTGPREEED